MKYTCPRCGYTTDKKSSMTTHLNRKFMCEPCKSDDVVIGGLEECCDAVVKPFPCRWSCGRSYRHESTESCHQKTCQLNPQEANKYTTSKSSFNTQHATGNQAVQVNGDHNQIHTTDKSTHVIINISSFFERLPQISHEQFIKRMEDGALNMLLRLIEGEHFNPEKPEQMNVYISNLKDKIGRVFDKNKWQVCDADQLKNDVYETYRRMVSRMVTDTEDNEEEVRKQLGKRYSILEKRIRVWEKQTRPAQFDDHAEKEVNLLLYNNRDLVRETHNLRF